MFVCLVHGVLQNGRFRHYYILWLLFLGMTDVSFLVILLQDVLRSLVWKKIIRLATVSKYNIEKVSKLNSGFFRWLFMAYVKRNVFEIN